MLLLTDPEVRAATAGPGVLDQMQAILARPADGALDLPPRLTIDARDGQGFLRLMPVIAYDTGYAGYKAMNLHPSYGVRYLIAMISLADGSLAALLDADWITAYRTAAVSAIAVRHLAAPAAATIGVLGSGTQARALLQTTAQVLTPARVLVYSPTPEHCAAFAAEMTGQLGIAVESVPEPGEVLAGSDVILSAYRAGAEPVIHAAPLRPGALVCGISSVRPQHREVDVAVWAASRVITDDTAHVLESGDGRAATAAGHDPGRLTELWQVLRDPALGRQHPDQQILFKSVGTAEQDIALAAIALANATSLGLGRDLGDFPSLRPIQARLTPTHG